MIREPKSAAASAGWVLLAIVVWLGGLAWARPLARPDEGRYLGVAWEMLQSGDWLTPRLDGLPFFHKPPLFYWISAAGMGAFGPNAWAGRIPSVLGAALGAFALFLLVRRWVGPKAAGATLLVLATQPLFFGGAQFANLDMLVAGCITATIALCAHAALSLQAGLPYRGTVAWAWVFAALGVLAKGLIGAVLPGLVVLAWLAVARQWRSMGALASWRGAVAFLLVAAPWFIAMQAAHPDFFHYFFVVQHFQRFAESGFNNVQPLWFYPVAIAALCLPWTAWLPATVRSRQSTDAATAGSLRMLAGIWLAAIVVFFSLPASKLIGYVLPALPPLAFLIADGALTLVGKARHWRSAFIGCAVLAAVLCVGIVGVARFKQPHSLASIGRALAEQRGPNEPVLNVDDYFYDVPFYARLRDPMLVVADWSDPAIARQDNWRKELADAGRFAPGLAANPLVLPTALPGILCAHPVSWVVGVPGSPDRFGFLKQATEIAATDSGVLWRVDSGSPALAAELKCKAPAN